MFPAFSESTASQLPGYNEQWRHGQTNSRPPSFWSKPDGRYEVNSGQLVSQWLDVALVTGALWLALKDREITERPDNNE